MDEYCYIAFNKSREIVSIHRTLEGAKESFGANTHFSDEYDEWVVWHEDRGRIGYIKGYLLNR